MMFLRVNSLEVNDWGLGFSNGSALLWEMYLASAGSVSAMLNSHWEHPAVYNVGLV